MKNKLSRKTICLTAAALVLAGSLSVGNAMAYFTTYTAADGGVTLDLGFTEGDKVEIEEKLVDGRKEVTISNTGDYDCYVRVIALTGDAYKDYIEYNEPEEAEKQWTEEKQWKAGEGGYYYYSDILEPGETTTQINVEIKNLKEEVPEGESPVDFNVIVIQEWTPVSYSDEGEPYADWNMEANISEPINEEGKQ